MSTACPIVHVIPTHHICCSQAGGGVQTSLRRCPGHSGHPQHLEHLTHCVSVTQQPQGVTQEVSRSSQTHVRWLQSLYSLWSVTECEHLVSGGGESSAVCSCRAGAGARIYTYLHARGSMHCCTPPLLDDTAQLIKPSKP